MANEEKLSGLTRSLLVGVSLGAISLTQVGCAPAVGTTTAAVQTGGAVAVRSEDERQICARALRSQSVSDVNLLLTRYPDSRCIVPLLSALPARVLAGLSPAAVAGVSPDVFASLPPRVAMRLPGTARPVAVAGAVRVDSSGDRY